VLPDLRIPELAVRRKPREAHRELPVDDTSKVLWFVLRTTSNTSASLPSRKNPNDESPRSSSSAIKSLRARILIFGTK